MKSSILFVALVSLFLVSGCYLDNSEAVSPAEVVIVSGNSEHRINAELAVTPEQHASGLMFRESLGENEGMLFIFNKEHNRSFWMKNTLIPLDIIFIDSDRKIINIETAQPCKEEPCKTYNSISPAKFVLEVNEYYSETRGIRKGDLIIFNTLQ